MHSLELIKWVNATLHNDEASTDKELIEYFRKGGTKETAEIFNILNKGVLKIDDNVYNKAHKYRIFYYSPKRVFVTLKIMRDGLNIHLFTNAKKIKGVESFGKDYAQKWGRMYVMNKKDIPLAVSAIKKSHLLINYCVENNIPTGWYAEAEE